MSEILSRVVNIAQRAAAMEQVSRLMTVVYIALCIFGLLNCILGYRVLRFWMMIFGFLVGAGAGLMAAYTGGIRDRAALAGIMAGAGIILAVISFLIYRAGIFVLGLGIGMTLSIYVIHPTTSFTFFLCILVGVGLGALAMRYAKGVIIVGTSILGGVLAGISIAKLGGLADIPYGAGLCAGIAVLGMVIQFTINRDHDEDDEEPDEYLDDEPGYERSEEDNIRQRKSSAPVGKQRVTGREQNVPYTERPAENRNPEKRRRAEERDLEGRKERRRETRDKNRSDLRTEIFRKEREEEEGGRNLTGRSDSGRKRDQKDRSGNSRRSQSNSRRPQQERRSQPERNGYRNTGSSRPEQRMAGSRNTGRTSQRIASVRQQSHRSQGTDSFGSYNRSGNGYEREYSGYQDPDRTRTDRDYVSADDYRADHRTGRNVRTAERYQEPEFDYQDNLEDQLDEILYGTDRDTDFGNNREDTGDKGILKRNRYSDPDDYDDWED